MTPKHTVEVNLPVHYFGSGVALISTLNADASTNLTPVSSTWSLDHHYVLGMARWNHGAENLERAGECVINFPDDSLASSVESIAATSGSSPLPAAKVGMYRTAHDKWAISGLTATDSVTVRPQRVAECPVQIECSLHQVVPLDADFAAYHVQIEHVHVHESLRRDVSEDRIEVANWRPLYYTFRHYFSQGKELGRTFKADY